MAPIAPGRELEAAEPDKNSYVITVIIEDVKKATALEIAETIQEDIDSEFGKRIGDVMILTAHMKQAITSFTDDD